MEQKKNICFQNVTEERVVIILYFIDVILFYLKYKNIYEFP